MAQALQEEFKEYAEKAKSLPSTTKDADKLVLYGLYKQATVCSITTNRPGFFSPTERAKWDAWKAVEDMTATLCLKATRSFLTPLPLSPSLPRLSFPRTLASVTMTSSFIEHVVLFKVKPSTDPTSVNSMVNGLNSLDLTLHLAAAPLLHLRSSPFAFTHLLHSRYPSKDSLAAYAAHPAHVSVVKDSILPICDDIMAVDWVSDALTSPEVAPGSAVRVTFLKVKEGTGEEEKGEILEVVKGRFSEVGEVSVGENFSPARAKGYSIGSVAVFKDVKAMESVDAEEEKAKVEKDKVREYLESVIVLDYVVRFPQSASL